MMSISSHNNVPVIRSVVKGAGSYLPEKIVTNEDLSKILDTSDEWIQQRTGIKQRRVVGENELTSDIAVKAGAKALENAGLSPDDVDLVLVATTTPDDTFPATATQVQAKLGMTKGAAFDIQAVCSGFIYGLATADSFIKSGQMQTVLLIGADCFSRILDYTDRTTAVLFGDGAAAIVLQAEQGSGSVEDRGILSSHIYSDGRYKENLYVDDGPGRPGENIGKVRMNGKEVFRHAVTNMAQAVQDALAHNQVTPEQIDWLIPHQANIRIIEGMGKKLKLPKDKVVVTVDQHANTSAASIPLAICEAMADGRLQKGHLILLEAMGGGFTWGASLVRW